MNSKLSKQFSDGLKSYNITAEQAYKDFKYVGGDSDIDRNYYEQFLTGNSKTPYREYPNNPHHIKYWVLCNPNTLLPDKIYFCICGHKIKENCYIENKHDGEILILGNCCINRFIKDKGRTCESCGSSHKNRNVNKCNKCRFGTCSKCGDKIDSERKYTMCWTCYKNY
jgi:hypothetical protein